METPNNYRAIVFGAGGLTGSHLIFNLSKDKRFSHIMAYTNSDFKNPPAGVTFRKTDIKNISIPLNTDVAFCTIGTTLKKAGNREKFEEIDMDLVIKIAEYCFNAGVKCFVYISSIGANPGSKNFYLKTKGKTEQKLLSFPFPTTIIVRPSLILGKRTETRIIEKIFKIIITPLSSLFIGKLLKYKPIKAEFLSKSMIGLFFGRQGHQIIECDELHLKAKSLL